MNFRFLWICAVEACDEIYVGKFGFMPQYDKPASGKRH